MNKDKKVTLGLISGSVLTVLAILGSTAGSLAWYAYSRNVSFSYVGTSVQKSVLLDIGLVDNEHYLTDDKLEQYELVRETHDTNSIVFSQTHKGFDVGAIRDYLAKSPNAVDMLFPLTTQKRSLSDSGDLPLYKSPDYGETTLDLAAKPSDYVELPFAFKIDAENVSSVRNKDVWLTDAVVEAEAENINQAVRVFIKNGQRKFLMKPAEKTLKSDSNKVGGLLDLDGDGTYDFDKLHLNEYYYGQYSGTLDYESTPYGIPYDEAPYDNVNNAPEVESTFYAKHHESAYCAKLDGLTPDEVEFYTFKSVTPLTNETGEYYAGDDGFSGIPICKTDSGDAIGYSTFQIYIEGWDHSVVDKAAGYTFNLGLRFEINRL